MLSETCINRCSRALSVVAFTGAGMSAESGVPTFRGNDGIWTKFKPEELANLDAFLRNTELVWEWYKARKKVISDVTPNAGHEALVTLEKMFPAFMIVTQNIDNLHRRAGSRNVIELHGNIEKNYCMACGRNYANEFVSSGPTIPLCSCGGVIRPDVVWFGEMLPEEEWDAALRACRSADVVLSIGTSGVVYPAASLPLEAKRAGAFIVEINPEPTSVTEIADEFVRGRAGEILPLLCTQLTVSQTQNS